MNVILKYTHQTIYLNWIEMWWPWRTFEQTHCHVLEPSLTWSESSDMLCYPAGSTWVHCGCKGTAIAYQQYSGRLWKLNNTQFVQRGPKLAPTQSPYQHQPEPLIQGIMDSCFHAVYTQFWPCNPNVWAEIEAYQTRPHFSKLLWSSVSQCKL